MLFIESEYKKQNIWKIAVRLNQVDDLKLSYKKVTKISLVKRKFFTFDKYQNIEYNNFSDRTTRITHLIVRCCRL